MVHMTAANIHIFNYIPIDSRNSHIELGSNIVENPISESIIPAKLTPHQNNPSGREAHRLPAPLHAEDSSLTKLESVL